MIQFAERDGIPVAGLEVEGDFVGVLASRPPSPMRDLAEGLRTMRKVVDDPSTPSDVKAKCRKWMEMANEMLRIGS